MKYSKKGIRGNNKVSNALNKPISGKLARRVSFKTKAIIFTLAFLAFLTASINKLGIETGLYFAIGFSIFGVVIYFNSRHQTNVREKITKKRSRNSSEDPE